MLELIGISTYSLFGQLLVGLINGAFYAILSLGLAVIFGLLNIINFTHGAQYALGAFVAGVLLSDSDFRHELEASIAPFQGLLMGFFFIAVGMGINLGMIVQHPINVIGFTIGLLAIKGFGLYGLRRLVG